MDINQFRRFRHHQGSDFLLILVLCIVGFSLLFTIISSRKSAGLDVYNEKDGTIKSEQMTEESTEKKIDASIYTDEKNGFSMPIPVGWEKVEKDGNVLFTHPESGSSMEIMVKDYNPELNNMDEATVSKNIANQGFQFVSFNMPSTSSYEAVYRAQDTNVYDYMEEHFWSKKKQVELLCVFKDSDLKSILPYYQRILKGFTWINEEDKISEDYKIYYFPDSYMQLGLPTSWVVANTDSVFSATDESGGSTLTTSCLQVGRDFDLSAGKDVMSAMSQGTQNFVSTSYTHTETSATAEGTYLSGTNQLTRRGYFFYEKEEGLLYCMVFDYQKGMLEDEVMDKSASYFQFFGEKLKEATAEQSPETSEQSSETSENSSETSEQTSEEESSESSEIEANSETTQAEQTAPQTTN